MNPHHLFVPEKQFFEVHRLDFSHRNPAKKQVA
jgi:hypothetical protein